MHINFCEFTSKSRNFQKVIQRLYEGNQCHKQFDKTFTLMVIGGLSSFRYNDTVKFHSVFLYSYIYLPRYIAGAGKLLKQIPSCSETGSKGRGKHSMKPKKFLFR